MRIIGDIHGRDAWKNQVDVEDINVFVGDYFDSFDIPIETQVENFDEIVDLKQRYPDRVVLLIGNHDYHYLVDTCGYSGWSPETFRLVHNKLNRLLKEHMLQWVYRTDNLLISHAGVTKTWMSDNKLTDIDQINEYLNAHPEKARFVERFRANCYGDDEFQGPLWVRPRSLIRDHWPINQIVGHTTQQHLSIQQEDYELWFIDTHNNEFLIIE